MADPPVFMFIVCPVALVTLLVVGVRHAWAADQQTPAATGRATVRGLKKMTEIKAFTVTGTGTTQMFRELLFVDSMAV